MGRDSGAPGWPRISPKAGLARQPLGGLGDHLFTVPGVLTLQEAQAFIDAAERLGFAHQGSRGPAFGEAHRDNHRISCADAALARQLWEAGGLAPLFRGLEVDGERAVGLNGNIRIYRYSPGQAFGKHIDDSVEVGPGLHTRYTLLVYLSGPSEGGSCGGGGGGSGGGGSGGKGGGAAGGARGGSAKAVRAARGAADGAAAPAVTPAALQPLVGGETAFYGARGRALAAVAPRPGLALLHLHGEDRCLEHEGAPVVSGTKYILRSDVVFSKG